MKGKGSVVKTFNGVPKDDKLKKFGNFFAKIIGVIILILLLLSISAKTAVKMTMVLTGANPIKAVKSSPSYNKEFSYSMRSKVYALPEKQAYTYDINKIQYFKVYTFLIFHVAIPTPIY